MKSRSSAYSHLRGFTLVEVLVAMVIGMIGMIIMLQVFATAEGQKRATTGTGDAQSSGAMAIYELQRDIRQSGYGFNSLTLLNCSLTLRTGVTLPVLAPVIINPPTGVVPAGDTGTDTLLVAYGNAAGSSEGDAIINASSAVLLVQTAANFTAGDRVIAAPNACTAALTLDQVTTGGVNVAARTVTVGAAGGNLLFNLGPAPVFRAYAIRAGNLTVCDYGAVNCGAACTAADGSCSADWAPIASNIVSLRAQYGRDTSTPPDGVDTWDRTTPTTACDWVRVSALRLAVVARNSQVERDVITAVAPTWAGSTGADEVAAPIDLSAGGTRANWKNYRYKVFETVVPIRNLPWMAPCP